MRVRVFWVGTAGHVWSDEMPLRLACDVIRTVHRCAGIRALMVLPVSS